MEKEQKKKYIQIIILGFCILVLGISIIFSSSITSTIKNALYRGGISASKGDLVVHFINVGQGDAIAINFPNQQVMLIDAGPKDMQNATVEYIKNNVLGSNKKLVIDYLILTHPDIDHSGGVSAIFSEFDVKNFYRPNIACESENASIFAMQSELNEYNELIDLSTKEKDLIVNIMDKEYSFYIGKALVEVFSPLKAYSTFNEMSPIVKVSYKDRSFLFTGDISSDVESDMIDYYGEKLDADVLKVAHHGSDGSTSEGFVNIVSPQYSVISVGVNSYGHPDFEVVTRLQNAGSQILTTINKNAIRFVCNDDGVKVIGENKIISFEFVSWWVIALFIIIIIATILLKRVFELIKYIKDKT